MPGLPPIPEQQYRTFRADEFTKTASKDLGLLEWRDQGEQEIDALEAADHADEQAYRAMVKAPPPAAAPPIATGNAAPGEYQDYARQAAQKAGIDPELFVRQIQQESGFDPVARSGAGAQGIAQIVPSAHPGVDTSDPHASLDYAANWMRELTDRYGGDKRKALAAYNAGPGAVDKAGGVPDFEETQRYVKTIYDDQGASSQAAAGRIATKLDGASTDDWYASASADLDRLEQVGESDRPPSEFEPTSGAGPRDLAPDQFGAGQGLSTAEAYRACGPAAAVAFARANGRNPSLREATDLAKQFGWTEGGGMNGPANQRALMQAIAPDTAVRLDEKPDAQKIATDALNGNVVTLSTRAHYYTVSGYDPKTEKLYVGATGRARKGGSEWMSLDDIRRLDGSVAALFVDSPLSSPPSVATDQGGDWFTKATGELDRLESAQQALDAGGGAPASGGGPPDQGGGFLDTLRDVGGRAVDAGRSAVGAVTGAVGGWADRVANPSPQIQTQLDKFDARTQRPGMVENLGAEVGEADQNISTWVEDAAKERAQMGGTPEERAAISARVQAGGPVFGSNDEAGSYAERIAPFALSMAGEPLKAVGGAVRAARGMTAAEGATGQPGMSLQISTDPDLAKIQRMYEEPPRASPVAAVAERLEKARTDFVRAWTDRGVDLGEFQARAKTALGRPLNVDEMAYEAARLNADMGAKVRVDQQLKPILQEAGEDYGYVRDYLTAQGNLDVATAKGNQARQFSGDIDAAGSQRALDAMELELGPQRFAKVQDLSTRVADFNRELLQSKLDAGLITKAQYAGWVKDYPTYSPVKITDYLKESMSGGSGGTSLSVRSNGIKVLSEEGTARLREDPIASTLRNAYETEALVRKNNTFNAFAKLRDADPALQQQIREVPTGYTATRNEQAVTGFIDGVRKSFVMPTEMALIVKQEGTAPVPVIGPLMQLFKMAVTSRNPVFLAGNAVNDAVSYVVRTSSREGGPQHAPAIIGDLAKAYVDAFSGLLSGEFRGDTARFLKEGGGQFGFFSRSEAGAKEGVEALKRSTVLTIDGVDDLKRLIGGALTLKPVETFGERIELAPRVAAFRRAEKAGENTTQAVLNGRTVTIDFAQGGAWAKQLNGFIPFFNVAMQAGATPARAVAENPRGAALTAMGLLVAPTVAAEAWNNADDQRKKDYADVPNYLKDQGIVLMIPGEAPLDERGERRPQFVHLKMRDYAPLVILTREIAKKVVGGESRDWASLLAGAAGGVMPVTGASQLIVPGVSTAVQLEANKDLFRGRDIATVTGDENAAVLSKGIAEAINAGAAAANRYPNVRPSQVDFATRDVGGGVANMVLSGSNLAAGKNKDSGTPQDIPGAGGFVSRFVRGDTGQQSQNAREERISNESKQMLYEAGLTPDVSTVKGEVNGAKLSRVEQVEYQRIANVLVEDALQAISTRGAWLTGDEAARKKLVSEAVAKAHERAKTQITRDIGSSELTTRRSTAALKKAG